MNLKLRFWYSQIAIKIGSFLKGPLTRILRLLPTLSTPAQLDFSSQTSPLSIFGASGSMTGQLESNGFQLWLSISIT